ncbi:MULTISPECIES: TetR/AcrR family transcriptional regulator [Streptomyces]|uniref:TetR/AcrR family transcriptional regulator n=1 Tax=Streptomyces TaxID=1883 RepID=UPI001E3553AE|nr:MULTISPECIES: TetR/AcrR family transcriptional regulator [Streptomyces]UFQ15981.1 TetR/AcrR family transcriptional regulator [Streptomyces huasconensis]WCL85585.1 TetR/AcrR family transcriptional regulator [Streptomyces sp. JCM 35825]
MTTSGPQGEQAGGPEGGRQGTPTGARPRRRAPAGAAVLREDVTQAIRDAVFEELASVGYARMSIEGIARRAGVGKTAVYRRWRSKLHLVLDLVSAIAVQGLPAPDTGSLEGDLRLLYEVTSRALRHPVASQIIPDLQAEAARNPEIAEALQKALREGQHGVASGIVRAAVERGELREGADQELALDLVSGPLYWRSVVVRAKPPKGYLARLAAATAAGLRAL